MAKRRRDTQTLGEYSWVLEDDDIAVQGEAAGLDTATGTVRPMGTSATQLFVGFFAESKTGDGIEKVRVALPDEVEAEWLDNDDSPNDADATTVGSEVYAKTARVVSTLSTGRSVAGRVLDFDADANKVLVQGGTAVTGPTGASIGAMHSVADKAALAALAAADRGDGMIVMLRSDGSLWRFVAASTATEDEAQELVIEPDAGTGAWLAADKSKILRLPFSFADADGHALLTVPAGFVLRLAGFPFWDITTSFSGGASSAIGVSTDVTGYTTEGDLLGGATGDVEAALTAGIRAGTLGGELDDHVGFQFLALVEGDVIEYDEITSAFTAGAGFVCIPVTIAHPAA